MIHLGKSSKTLLIFVKQLILTKGEYFSFSNLEYSKICVNGHSKKDKTRILLTNGSSMKIKSIAECSAILLTCIKLYLVLKANFLSFWEWVFYSGFTVLLTYFIFLYFRARHDILH